MNTKSLKRKALIYTMLVVCLAAIAAIVIVAVSLGSKTPIVNPPVNNDPDPGTPVAVSMLVPVAGVYSIDKEFAVDKLLYSTTLKLWQAHRGIDLKAEKGTNVVAVLGGTIEKIGDSTLDGGFVIIDHGEGLKTIYKSLALKNTELKAGDTVTRGQVIGQVGDTMLTEIAQGAHLHFEIMQGSKYVSPASKIDALATKG